LRERGMHTNPSLLAGDTQSGSKMVFQNDMEPLALKKFQNFKEYVSIYPEFSHVFVGDTGQGDVRSGELMNEAYPDKVERLYMHIVQTLHTTHGYDADRYSKSGLDKKICFFRTYVEAGLDAASQSPPLILNSGLRRICLDAVKDFHTIPRNKWPSKQAMIDRRKELNQSIWLANRFLVKQNCKPCPLILASPRFNINERVTTTYGSGWVKSYDPVHDLYKVELDWRPIDVQLAEYKKEKRGATPISTSSTPAPSAPTPTPSAQTSQTPPQPLSVHSSSNVDVSAAALESVAETDEYDVEIAEINSDPESSPIRRPTERGGLDDTMSNETPPSSIADRDETSSVADSEREFYRNVMSSDGLRQFGTNTYSHAMLGSNTHSSPAPSSSRFSPGFSPASNAVTPRTTNHRSSSPIPELIVGPSAFDAGVSDQDGVSSVGDLGERDVNASTVSSRSSTTKKNAVFAYVQSNDLHHYKPPVLMYDPALEDVAPTARDKSRSIFNSFGYFNRGALSPSPHRLSDVGDAYVPVVKVGDNVRTFYGEGRVKAVRATDAIVEVKMWNWTARCYLREEDVEVVEKPEKVGFLGLFGRGRDPDMKVLDVSAADQVAAEEAELVSFAIGDEVKTPWGDGVVVVVEEREDPDASAAKVKGEEEAGEVDLETQLLDAVAIDVLDLTADDEGAGTLAIKSESPDTSTAVVKVETPPPPVPTITFLTVDFTCMGGRLHCTAKEASGWQKTHRRENESSGLMSYILAPLRRFTAAPPKKSSDAGLVEPVLHEQYFPDQTVVLVERMGRGRVLSHRPETNVYVVELSFGTGYLNPDVLSFYTAPGCAVDGSVLTSLGLTGNLVAVDPRTSVHHVQMDGMLGYLQPDAVLGPVKAAVGTEVVTVAGSGVVVKYRPGDRMFEVRLDGWNARIFCTEADMGAAERESSEGGYGWLSGWFWARKSQAAAPPTRPARSRQGSKVSEIEALAG
ncbi:hypothetical protein TeGR_g4828, partial [Tetraparma gracilis]